MKDTSKGKRIISLTLCALMATTYFPATAFAVAAPDASTAVLNEVETPSYPAELSLSVTVKANATEASLKSAVLEELKKANSSYPIESITWPEGVDFNTDGEVDVTVNYTGGSTAAGHINVAVMMPTSYAFAVPDLPTINASNEKNKSSTALLGYVNSDLNVVPTGDNSYAAALGVVNAVAQAKKFTWNQCDTEYKETGGMTYTFTQEFTPDGGGEAITLKRTVTVETSTHSIGSLSIDYGDNTVNTKAGMKWSFDKSKWSSCSDNMKIQSSWYDKRVYFYYPSDKWADESEVVSLYIPPKGDKPEETLELTSTSHSVTIQNCWDFGDVEFSINGGSWRSTNKKTYTFDNLKEGTSYSVAVRTCADPGDYLASDSVTKSIKTKEKVDTKVTIDDSYEGKTGYINAFATISPDVSSHTLRGSLTSNHLRKLENAYSVYSDRFNDVNTTMLVEHFGETDDIYDVTGVNFSLPLSPLKDLIRYGDLTLEYRTDMGRVYFDNAALESYRAKSSAGTLSINMQIVTSISNSSTWKWLYNELKAGATVYKITVTGSGKTDANLSYFIPYELGKNETIGSLSLYHVDSKGKNTRVDFEYDSALSGLKFNYDESGYFVISSDGSSAQEFPFRDVPSTYWAHSYVSYCYNKGLFSGTSSTTFSPTSMVTRGTIFTVLARLDDYDAGKSVSTPYFTDVKSTDWYAAASEWAHEKGLVSGKTFNGEGTMQRQEIAKVLYDYLNKSGVNVKYDSKLVQQYNDQNTINSSYRTAVLALRNLGVMQGVNGNNFAPTSSVTRAELATILYRMHQVMN